MFGPRSAYDSQTLAEFDRRAKDADFERRLISALAAPGVRRALRAALDLAEVEHTIEAVKVAGRG